ncbi:hypothetical protein I3843_03G050000 [Carya illinoinensis]|uniref:Uncharacterized protein n=1 Tax=Carya illinoinensis TaxID=32201 RepID=A0A8T1R0I6_CARIL|nr:uncharacterized protein At3g27210-like [Carya illinoinensis]KAG2714838.1 hypothetical protein I3760_03G046900 [Carya illinoinensis]KAG6659702.1 hypothetical protein CIPAW_03G053800 [Carya illinoinensis]KAG6720237.1 hypothetical protein I3842_03G049000 [Carya illinoinensis]KAG7985886.1 hypothetical protein I3843_03G050000 [Carya illinoinensis]
MGSCASLHRSSDSAMKLVIPPSPIKEIPTNGNPPIENNNVVAAKSQWPASRQAASFGGYGSKEETFFDSQAWLDSDCDDDFFSVNGDFTPSRGNTPLHNNFSTGIPRVDKVHSENRIPGSPHEPSPKKKLIELFRESIRQDQDVNNLNTSGNQNISDGKMEVKPTVLDVPPKSAHGTPYGTNSVCSSERTSNGDLLTEKEKPFRPVQCCLPSLISCRSFSERKKKMDPSIAVVD